jgi:D-alanyl-D-alanine carboxypeptidase (penicillin-binding protein 5/6)
VPAPVAKGQALGELVVSRGDLPELRIPLVANADVEKGGFVNRIVTVSGLLLNRLNTDENAM